ncbi:MAG: iron ABC transporter permease [Bacillus sp. (in: firmicutes)]
MTLTLHKPKELPIGEKRSKFLAVPIILIGGLFFLIFFMVISIIFGSTNIELKTVWDAIFHYNSAITQHKVIWDLRMPRVVASALVGACFAVSGALMQGMTRNPLADSGILGLNAGAGFVLAVCSAFFPALPFIYLIMYSFLGAGFGASIVYSISSFSKGPMSPVRLVLAGTGVSALLVSLSQGLAIYFQIGQDLAYWYAGGMAGINWLELKIMFPWVACALVAAIIISPSITILSLGEDVAIGLGHRTKLVSILGIVIVLILAGSAVSIVGSVGFVGLIVPHLTRYLVGVDYRRIIPCSAVLGGLLMVLADLGSRTINPPFETPIGVIIALIGIPFFLYLARRKEQELQ